MAIRLVMLGDIVGMPGVNAVIQLMGELRRRWKPDRIIANAENAHRGSGLTPELYHKLVQAGVHAITLGDHVYKHVQITKVLEQQENIIRPANLSRHATGRRWMKLSLDGQSETGGEPRGKAANEQSGDRRPPENRPNLYVMTVLGRIFSSLPADDPFETVQSILGHLPDLKPIVLLEVHCEATSEKLALGHYFDGIVSAVIGTHTHVATADARILPRGTAYITDLGMCGPHDSIIGRRIDRVLKHMTTALPAPFDVAEADPRINGVFVEIDPQTRHATKIERIEMCADPLKPPFVTT